MSRLDEAVRRKRGPKADTRLRGTTSLSVRNLKYSELLPGGGGTGL